MTRLILICCCVAIALLVFPTRQVLSGIPTDDDEPHLDPRIRNIGLLVILAAVTDSTTRILVLFTGVIILFVFVPWLERRPDQQERVIRDIEFPTFLDYLHMCVAAGLSIADSFERIELQPSSRLASDVKRINELYQLGAPINEAVENIARDHPTWLRLSEVITRSYQTGASVKESIQVIAQYLRATGEVEAVSRIRALAVKCTLPLGLCFLPAFVLLSIVPVVASLYKTMF